MSARHLRQPVYTTTTPSSFPVKLLCSANKRQINISIHSSQAKPLRVTYRRFKISTAVQESVREKGQGSITSCSRPFSLTNNSATWSPIYYNFVLFYLIIPFSLSLSAVSTLLVNFAVSELMESAPALLFRTSV